MFEIKKGVYEYYNCEEIIIDFEYSGEGPKIQKFAGPAPSDEPPLDIVTVDKSEKEKKKKNKNNKNKTKEDEMAKNTMDELFEKLKIDMSQFPVHIQECVADTIQNIPISQEKLEKSRYIIKRCLNLNKKQWTREYLKDKELMSYISHTTTENQKDQFQQILDVTEEVNNKIFMQEFVHALSVSDDLEEEDDTLSKPYVI